MKNILTTLFLICTLSCFAQFKPNTYSTQGQAAADSSAVVMLSTNPASKAQYSTSFIPSTDSSSTNNAGGFHAVTYLNEPFTDFGPIEFGESVSIFSTENASYALFKNGVYQSDPVKSSTTGGYNFAATLSGNAGDTFAFVRKNTSPTFGPRINIKSAAGGKSSLGFDSNGNYQDLNLNYGGTNRMKFAANGTAYINDTNGNNVLSADTTGTSFGDGKGGSSAKVSTNGYFSGTESASNILGIIQPNQLPSTLLTNFYPDRADLLNAVQELNALGQLSFLNDFAAFEPQYGMTNTFKGFPITFSNTVSTLDGVLVSNSTVSFQSDIPPTNTIVVVWSPNPGDVQAQATCFWHAVNTNNFSSEYCTFQSGASGWMNPYIQSNLTAFPSVLAFSNLIHDPWYGEGITWFNQPHLRRVQTFSYDGKGTIVTYRDGMVCSYDGGGGQGNSYITGMGMTNHFNRFNIGHMWATNGAGNLFQAVYNFQGTIESVWIFNKAADTNLLQAVEFASDWTQRFTKKRFEFGDSLMLGNAVTAVNGYTNLVTMAYDKVSPDAIYFPFFAGGWSMVAFNNSSTFATNCMFFYNKPHGKITSVEAIIALGANDLLRDNDLGTNCFGYLTNTFVKPMANQTGWSIDVFNVNQTSTNGQALVQTASSRAQVITYNGLLNTYRYMFRRVINRDVHVTQSMMSTNRVPRLSTDGCHFNDPTNGDAAYRYLAGEVIDPNNNPYVLPDLCKPEPFPFPATTATWTNVYSYPIQVLIDNTGVTSTGLQKNGVTISSVPTGTIRVDLLPNDYISETYAAGTPKATYQAQR